MPKNKQIVISLHEGCLEPDLASVRLLGRSEISDEAKRAYIKNFLLDRLRDDPDCILIDKVEVIDCDCDSVYTKD